MSRDTALVSVDWAEKHLSQEGVVFVEVDEDTEAYGRGHLPGAVAINWRTELQDAVRRDILSKKQFEDLLSTNGVAVEDTLVVYGGNNNWFAAYFYWYCKLYGHGDVRLIDGGRKKWQLEGRPLTTEVIERVPTVYMARHDQDPSLRAFRDEVIGSIGLVNLVDVRSPDEYTGRILAPAHLPQEQAQRPGHIPTAVNVPWSLAAHEDGTFKSDTELRELYAAELDLERATIAYCRIGERAAHTWFVLKELLGYEDVRNYDGSWSEYGSLIGTPIAVGANPQ